MNLSTIPIKDINPAKYNPRKNLKPGDPEYEKLKKSITEFDMVEPLILNKRGNVLIGGHQRLKVLKEMGRTQVEVSVVDLPPAKEKALNLALNKISGEWDMPLLKDLLQEIDTGEFDIEITGFDSKEIEDLINQLHKPEPGLTDEDEVPEPKESICKPGDLWVLGNHRLLCGDATVVTDVERLMDGAKADMVFTDPPYGVDYGEKNRFLNSFQPSGRNLKDIAGDALSKDELLTMLTKAFTLMRENSQDECSYYVTAPQGGELGLMMMMMMMSGLPVRHVLIWVKNQPGFSLGRLDYDYQHEPILYAWNKKHRFIGKGQHTKSVWAIDRPRENKEHPTMKPIVLMENALLNSSKTGDVVCDWFSGSGSTLIACEKLGRRCYGMEIDPHYCDVIINRWQNFTGKTAELLK